MNKDIHIVPPYNHKDELRCLPRLVLIMLFVAIIAVVIWVVVKFMTVFKL